MKNKVLLVGDSLTEGFNVCEYLPNYNISNGGIYGDNTSGVLERLERLILKETPFSVFILIGTNDLALERTISEISSNIESIVKITLRYDFIKKIYITSLLPTRNVENRQNHIIRELNSELVKISIDHQINYFDLNSRFSDEKEMLKTEFTDDGLHLTKRAYKEWADALKFEIDIIDESK